jgi:hypothetical protein
MRQRPLQLIVEVFSPYARASLACARGITSLNHEFWDIAMEGNAAVVPFLCQFDKVPHSFRRKFRVKLQCEVAQIRLYPCVALGLDALRLEHIFLLCQKCTLAACLRRQARAGETGGRLASCVCSGVGSELLLSDEILPCYGTLRSGSRLLQSPRAAIDVTTRLPSFARLLHRSLGLQHLVAHAAQRSGIDTPRLRLLLLGLCGQRLQAILEVLELLEVPARGVLRILQRDDVGARERLVVDEVLPHLGLDIHALDRLPRKHVRVRPMPHGHDVRVVREHLVRDGVDEITLAIAQPRAAAVLAGVARKVQPDQVLRAQRLAVDGVLARVLVEPGADDLDVEDGAVGRADRVLERLERGGAEAEGEAAEGGGAGGGGFRADAG